MFALISINPDKTINLLFQHECPEPVYDMQGKYLRLDSTLDLQVMEMSN